MPDGVPPLLVPAPVESPPAKPEAPAAGAHLWRQLAAWAVWPFRTLAGITRDGVVLGVMILLLALAALRSEQLANIPLLICLVLCSLAVTGLVLGARCLDRLTVTRRSPERTFADERVTVTLSIANAARLPVTGLALSESLRPSAVAFGPDGRTLLVSDAPPAETGREEATLAGQAFALAVAGGGQERVRYALLARRRGVYTFAPLRLSTVFPFGLWRTQTEQRVPGRLIVYPRLGVLDTALFRELELSLERIRRRRDCREEQDFRGLREFRHGDSPKWIHWRSSAHQGRPFVKEFEEPQAKRVLLFVDTHPGRMGAQRLPAFEWAVSFAATAARELARRDCEVTCGALPPGAPFQWLTVSRERRNLDRLLEMLAALRPDPARTLAEASRFVPRAELREAYVLVLGLGSLRVQADLGWLHAPNNEVRVLDVRGEEFRRIFHRGAAGEGGLLADDELLPEPVEEAAVERGNGP